MTNALCLDEFCSDCFGNDLNATFDNCIIYGNRSDELSFFIPACSAGSAFNYELNNCVVRVDEILDADNFPDFFDNCNNCINSQTSEDALFADYLDSDFHLDTLSIAEMQGFPIPGISEDLDGELRDGVTPDIGCYEYIY